ncbi:helix-turn-helix transcriptional regulator [Actinophytocola sp.]|uniref:helix-turn-helix domain-containing protein n=1 Tax=Actinophytocola sp. TaxID=1872138 RepID=UPI002D8013C2|nr:helix-turn-helix transcriptional regulator [Actinophytocola sp.]HET9137987.1 helix-turn-helix transcriptional regulator [Actinophytocola sp.]
MATQNPQRVELGDMLRRARESAGLTPAAIEGDLGWYTGKVSRVERGSRVPVPAEIDRLADLYQVAGEERTTLRMLADAARKREAPARVADFAQTYVALERAAAEIRYYDAELVPGLLQSEGYARALLAHLHSQQQSDEVLAARVARQAILRGDNPPDVRVVLGEAALHRLVGGEEVLQDQIRHLLHVAALPNVAIRIMPFTSGAHRAIGVGFTWLRLGAPPIARVYIEGLTDATYLQDPDETAVYAADFEEVWAAALSQRDSATILRGRITAS